jgi:hypothetical protein
MFLDIGYSRDTGRRYIQWWIRQPTDYGQRDRRLDDDRVSYFAEHGSGMPDSPLSQDEMEEKRREAEEERWDVPTNRHHPHANDDTTSGMEAGDVDTTPNEEDPESDDSTDGEDDDPMPPSAEEDEVIARWAWIGGAMREAQNADEDVMVVKAWVETDERPQAFQLDTESQEVRALVCRWHELFVRDGILMRRAPRGDQVVLPRSTRADILRPCTLDHGPVDTWDEIGRTFT